MTLVIGHDYEKIRALIYLRENERAEAQLQKSGQEQLHFGRFYPDLGQAIAGGSSNPSAPFGLATLNHRHTLYLREARRYLSRNSS